MNILYKITRKILKLNKTRTWVTVIGIILSAAMFTAVTTSVSSLQNFLLRTVIASDGSWYGVQYNADAEDLAALQERKDVKDYTVLERVGYAPAGSKNAYKPYLMIYGIDDKTVELLPIHLTAERLPENDGELLLPAHLESNGQVTHTVGETLNLEIGSRVIDGDWTMDQSNPYDEKEQLVVTRRHTYTVVGFYERPSFEDFSAPGYSALTYGTGNSGSFDLYIRTKTPKDIYALLDDSACANKVNTELLRYTGMSNEGSYNRVLFGMAGILMGIIVFGSIALIYNAFSISVSERTKQFGVLKTIGATKRQLRASVIYEALLLSAVGIPLGVLSGILGIYITLRCTGGMFDALELSSYDVALRLHISAGAVIVAAAVCLITVLISAWIPARRAIRQSAIESVRQSADIAIHPRKIKSPRWVYKIFGFEGLLADKNFRRNRKRYRATVVSLFISVVLFISASSFCAYLTDAVNTVVYAGNYDLSYHNQEYGDYAAFKTELENLKSVEEVVYFYTRTFSFSIPEEALSAEYLALHAKEEEESRALAEAEGEPYTPSDRIAVNIMFLDDDAFRSWAEKQGQKPEAYFEEPKGIAVDGVKRWDGENGRYQSLYYLKNETTSYSFIYIPEEIADGYYFANSVSDAEGNVTYYYENGEGGQISYSEEDPLFHRAGEIGAVVAENPLGAEKDVLQIVYPLSMYNQVMPASSSPPNMEYQMTSSSPSQAEEEVRQLLEDLNMQTAFLNNMVEDSRADRALVGVINVFSYGFIILISLIALANVFNTISTNIALRRREFAMLRSVGMTERGLNKMMNYECILYGVKGLSLGLAAAVAVTFLIYRIINSGVVTSFYIPWYSVTIAVGSVFLVVFSTMLYAMRKIKKDDPMDALKNENI